VLPLRLAAEQLAKIVDIQVARVMCGSARQSERSGVIDMPTYILLPTLTPEGVQAVKNNPQRIEEVNKEAEQLDASVEAQ
jgi:hypothetical protein